MRITEQRVTCGDCKVVSDVEMVVDCPLDVAIASMRAARCPQCHSANLYLGGAHAGAPPADVSSLDARAEWWLEHGDRGVSSETIFSAFRGGISPLHAAIPYDPDDFGRCKRLLDLMPEWRADLNRVSALYPWFKPMIDQWDEIERLYILEEPTGSAPQCYDFMRPLVEECQRLRNAK